VDDFGFTSLLTAAGVCALATPPQQRLKSVSTPKRKRDENMANALSVEK
jgi:hypothetical protein